MKDELYFCDNDCEKGELKEKDCYFVETLPCDIRTANKGESAVLCKDCYDNLNIKGD